MKIIHIDFVESASVKQLIHELATKQCASGLDIEVWHHSKDIISEDLFPSKYVNIAWLKFTKFGAFKKAIQHIEESVIFHLHGAFIPELNQVANILAKKNIPFVFTPHTNYKYAISKNSIKKIQFSLFDKKILNKAYAIHVLNYHEAKNLKSIYNNKKTIVIPYGFNLINNYTDLSKPAKTPFIVAFSGEISIAKNGLDVLLNGFKTFHKKFPESKLWIIGEGEDKAQLKILSQRKGMKDVVVFYDQIQEKEKVYLLQQCHVFAQPSRSHEFSSEAFEAASLGVPCMVTKSANMVDGIKNYEAGYVIDGISSLYISQGLNELYHHIILRGGEDEMRLRAKMMVRENYNWNQLIAKYQILYRNILSKSTEFAY